MLIEKMESTEKAKEKLKESLKLMMPEKEVVPINEAYNRILAEDIISEIEVPGFLRTAMDGYALHCEDAAEASPENPVKLKYIGEVEMGKPPQFTVGKGECAYVPTGGMMPEGADGIVIIENTDRGGDIPSGNEKDIENLYIEMRLSAVPGANLVEPDEDVAKGELVLASGRRIRPQEMGILAALGKKAVSVYKPYSMAIISTGDELVSIDDIPAGGQVRDINSYTMLGLAEKYGMAVTRMDLLKDKEDLLEEAVRAAMNEADIIAISGGSSVGKKDATARIIDEVADPGVFIHGVALKPGRPTILGLDEKTKTLFVGVPGHPASAMMSFELIVTDTIREMITGAGGSAKTVPAVLKGTAKAKGNRDTCITVRLAELESAKNSNIKFEATPVKKKSGAISMLSQADGYILIPAGRNVADGETVQVRLL